MNVTETAAIELAEITVRRIVVGEMQNNVYLLTSKEHGSQVLIDAAADAVSLLRERGRLLSFLPRPAEVGGSEDGGAEVSGLGGGEQRAAVARIEHDVMNDVAKQVRAVGAPASARARRPHRAAGATSTAGGRSRPRDRAAGRASARSSRRRAPPPP